VWRNLEDAQAYFDKIEGKVRIMNEIVTASIYSVIVPRGWEQDTVEDSSDNTKWRSLNTYALVIGKVKNPVEEKWDG